MAVQPQIIHATMVAAHDSVFKIKLTIFKILQSCTNSAFRMKISNFRGDLTSSSAKTKTLVVAYHRAVWHRCSADVQSAQPRHLTWDQDIQVVEGMTARQIGRAHV